MIAGAPLPTLKIAESDFPKLDQVVQFGLPPYRIDIMTSLDCVGSKPGAAMPAITEGLLAALVQNWPELERATGAKT